MQERYSIDEHNILGEYPRPQLVRGSYENLNGWWDFAISDEETRPQYFPLKNSRTLLTRNHIKWTTN